MKLPWLIFERRPHQSALPTITTDQRGQVRMLTGDGATTDDELWFGANDAATLEWRKIGMAEDVSAEIDADVATHAALTVTHGATGAIVGTTNAQTLTNKTLTTPIIGDFSSATHTHINNAGGGTLPFYYATFGPFFINDLPGTATTAFQAGFFDTATTVSRSTMDVYMPLAGEVVGMWVVSDANRTAGTADVRCLINGVSQTFDGGGTCILDGTNTRRHGVTVARGDGEDFAMGNRVALEAITSGWTPTTANLTAWFLVRYDF
jgi:hypothetical protein